MLTLLAALIPIAASLYVAVSTLAEQSRLASERRIRIRVAAIVRAQADAVTARARDATDGTPYYVVAMNENHAFAERMLSYNGIATGPTVGEHDINISMSGPEMSLHQRRGQWILILSAVAGVVLLALGDQPVP